MKNAKIFFARFFEFKTQDRIITMLKKIKNSLIVLVFTTYYLLLTAYSLLASPLDLQLGVRPQGMGGAYIAVSDDVSASYWNPAGLVQIPTREVIFTHYNPFSIDEISVNFFSVAQPIGKEAGLALSWVHKGAKCEECSAVHPDEIDESQMNEDSYILSGGYRFDNHSALGLNLKRLSIDSKAGGGTGYGFDFGIFYDRVKNLTAGLMYRNAGSGIKNEKFTSSVRMGIAARLFEERLTLAFDINNKKGVPNNIQYHLGAEYKLFKNFHLRAGLDDGAATAGLGFRLRNWRFDYAYTNDNEYDLEPYHQFGVVYFFPQKELKPADSDGDGILDIDDKCPYQPEDYDRFQDEDGCPDPDNDRDRILDIDDECPNDPEDYDQFQDKDGCPDPDNDQDGILDIDDKCPNIPETFNNYNDEDGCPDTIPTVVSFKEIGEVTGKRIIISGIHFEFDKAIIKERSKSILDKVAGILKEHSQMRVRIEGHTDSKGSDEYNDRLSEERARAVRDYLIGAGIEKERLVAIGRGAKEPIADNSTEESRARNRRIEFVILEGGPVQLETRPQTEDLYLEEKKEIEPKIEEEIKPKKEETEEKPRETKEPEKGKIHATDSVTITVVEPKETEIITEEKAEDREQKAEDRGQQAESRRPANAGAPKAEDSRQKEELSPISRPGNLQMEVKLHEDQEYVKLYIKVKNIGQEPVFVSPFNFFLILGNGKGYGIDYFTFSQEGYFDGARIDPGEEREGFIFFKTKAKPAKLIYEDYLGNSTTFDF